jgi:hypothetical protein
MLFDQFSQAQAGNGQNVQPPQPTMGVPGFNPQSWGNQPTNFAGGMQNFLRSRMGAPMMPPTQQPGGIVPPGGPPVMGTPDMMPTPPSPMAGGGGGGNMSPGQVNLAPAMPPNVASNVGQPNFAGGMQQFLGRPGMMR